MRRGRIFATAVVLAVMLATAAAGVAATPQQLFSKNAVTQGYGGVGGQTTTPAQNQQPVTQQVAGANKTVQRPTSHVAPATAGTLPFTGLQLGVFALIGFALIGGGLLVRRVGNSRTDG
jgi:hypothetical protein